MSHVAVSERGSNGMEWRAVPEAYETLLHAFESGAALLSFTTIDGAEVTVRGCAVVAIGFVSDAAIAATKARVAADEMGTP
jgi:hypothetical protein